MTPVKGVFCLEGYSSISLNAFATLQLLRKNCGVAYFYQAPVTYDQFWQYLTRWIVEDGELFPVLYLAFHGEEGILSIGEEAVSLEELAAFLKDVGSGKWLHISACSTLGVHDQRLKQFLATTGFHGISGYDFDVTYATAALDDYFSLKKIVSRSAFPYGKRAQF